MAQDVGDQAPVTWPQVTGQAISDFLDFSPRWLKKLEEQGFVERNENGLFDAGSVSRGYIRWLKDDARRSTKTEGARLKEAEQLRKLRIENAKAIGELVEMELVEVAFVEIFTMLRNEIGAVPAGITRDPKLRADIEQRLNLAYARCQKGFEELQKKLPAGSWDDVPDDPD